MTVSSSLSYANVVASRCKRSDSASSKGYGCIGWGIMKYFDINVLIYYLSSPPHTVRPWGTLSCASLSCRMGTPPVRTAYSLHV